jgi:hypothetical protein
MNTVGINSIALWKIALTARKETMDKAIHDYNSYVAEIRNKITDDNFLKAYITYALEFSTDSNDVPLEKNYNKNNIALDTLFAMVQDCFNFRVNNAAFLKELDLEKSAQDFWLIRNQQPSEFWANMGEAGNHLINAAAKFTKVHLHVADDGLIYQYYWSLHSEWAEADQREAGKQAEYVESPV